MTSQIFEIQETAFFHEPIDKVWDALVVQNGLKHWLNARLFVLEIDDSGLIEISFSRAGKAIDVLGETSFINPNHQLMFTWIERDESGQEWAFPTVVSLKLDSTNNGTHVTLTHKGLEWLPPETRDGILAQYKHFWQGKMGKSLQKIIVNGEEAGERLVCRKQ